MKEGSTSKVRAELARWMLRLSHKAVPMVKKRFNLRGIDLFVPEGIFNPAFTFSTELMMEYVEKVGAEGKALEIGCGSGALSIFIAKRFSVEVHCFDISPLSIRTTKINAELNGVGGLVKPFHIKDLPANGKYDLVLSNPPYLPLDPLDYLDLNWCGGRNEKLLKAMLRFGVKKLRDGGDLIFSLSSLSGQDVLKELLKSSFVFVGFGEKMTPLDFVYVFHFRKIFSNTAP